MNDFTIRRVTDPKEGPIDGVSAETVGVYTKFRGKGLFQAEKRIIKQETTDVGIKAAVSTGVVSIYDRKHSKRHDNAVTCESTQRSDRWRNGSEIQRESCSGYF